MTTPDLTTITLASGSHDNPDDGLCLLEAVAWFRGIAHTDHPACVSPVLAAFGRIFNDYLPADIRQQLVPFIPRMPGTAGDEARASRPPYGRSNTRKQSQSNRHYGRFGCLDPGRRG